MFSIVDFISVRNQNNTDPMKQFKILHQNLEFEGKNADLIVRKESDLQKPLSRPKRHSKRARNAQVETPATSSAS